MTAPSERTPSGQAAVDLVVMLAGGLKPSPLAAAAGRSVLDLSVDGKRSILDHWLDHLAPLAKASPGLPVRILHGSSLAPVMPAGLPLGLDVSIQRETKEFRGPAGVVKDAAEHLPPDATVLVIEAARWFAGDLVEVVRSHHSAGAGQHTAVTVVAGAGKAPAGIVVLERSTLDPISQLGFMDLKEQWLGKVAETGRPVRVVDLGQTPSILLREREGFLRAARSAVSRPIRSRLSEARKGIGEAGSPLRSLYTEHEQGYFAAVSPESTIEPNTSIVDSVIMGGAVVKAGAIVARSVVCPGAVVSPAEVVVDRVYPGPVAAHVDNRSTVVRSGAGGEHSG